MKCNAWCRDDGVGLAAPQVGVNIRLMVFNPSGDRRAVQEQLVLVNPEIIEEGGPRRDFEEGCLSFPKMFANVEVCPCTFTCFSCFLALLLNRSGHASASASTCESQAAQLA